MGEWVDWPSLLIDNFVKLWGDVIFFCLLLALCLCVNIAFIMWIATLPEPGYQGPNPDPEKQGLDELMNADPRYLQENLTADYELVPVHM